MLKCKIEINTICNELIIFASKNKFNLKPFNKLFMKTNFQDFIRRNALLTLLGSSLLLFSACNEVDDVGDDVTTEETEAGGTCDLDKHKLLVATAYLGASDSPLLQKIKERANTEAEVEEAELVLVDGTTFISNDETIKKAYNRGATIAVVAPNLAELKRWKENNSLGFICHEKEDLLVYAFNNEYEFYTMDVPSVDSDDIFHKLSNSFIHWANNKAPVVNRSETRANTEDIRAIFNSQSITHTYSICVDEEIANVLWSNPDRLTKSSTVDVSYNIYPMHAFSTTTAPGDYYLVEASIVAHNGNMYKGKWTSKHGGVYAHLCGYYMSKLEFNTVFLDENKKEFTSVKFPAGQTPHPGTTVGSTSYTDGFSWGLNGNITGGYSDGFTLTGSIGFDVGWSSSETRDCQDVEISLNSTPSNIRYSYEIENLPSKAGPSTNPSIPKVAVNDMDMFASWVWYVPSATDYSNDKYNLQMSVVPYYKAYHWYSTAADFDSKGPYAAISEGNRTETRALLAPCRIPTGLLTITNTSRERQYVGNIQIWKKGSTSSEPEYTINQTIASNAIGSTGTGTEASIILPVGEYTIKCEMYNKQDGGEKYDIRYLESDGYTTITIGETKILNPSADLVMSKQ